jgi:hypothetical protein
MEVQMTKEEMMKRNAARGSVLRATMQSFETNETKLVTSGGTVRRHACNCSIALGDVSPTGRLKHRPDCGVNTNTAPAPPPIVLRSFCVNGAKLGAKLTKMIADQANGNPDGLKARLATAMGIEPDTLASLMAGKMDYPHRSWLQAAAGVLGVSLGDLLDADQPATMLTTNGDGVPKPPKFLTRPV